MTFTFPTLSINYLIYIEYKHAFNKYVWLHNSEVENKSKVKSKKKNKSWKKSMFGNIAMYDSKCLDGSKVLYAKIIFIVLRK
jgi:hypothetical protein